MWLFLPHWSCDPSTFLHHFMLYVFVNVCMALHFCLPCVWNCHFNLDVFNLAVFFTWHLKGGRRFKQHLSVTLSVVSDEPLASIRYTYCRGGSLKLVNVIHYTLGILDKHISSYHFSCSSWCCCCCNLNSKFFKVSSLSCKVLAGSCCCCHGYF